MPDVLQRRDSPLSRAIEEILATQNLYVLGDADLLIVDLRKVSNKNDPEIRMLVNNLDNEVLQPLEDMLSDCAIFDEKRIRAAARETANKLTELHDASFVAAASAMEHVADGICLHLKGNRRNNHLGSRNGRPTPIRSKTIAALATAAILTTVLITELMLGITVTFDGNGATTGETAAIYALRGSEIILPKPGFYRSGYTFIGWSQAPDGDAGLAPGEAIEPNKSLVFYALWHPEISFDGNGADSGMVELATTSKDNSIKLPENAFVRNGYEFGGWSTDATSGKILNPGDEVSASKPTTYYAVWLPLVSFNGNGATGGNMDALVQNANDEVELPKCSYTRDGCDFIGWLRDSSGYKQGSYYDDADLLQPNDVLKLNGEPAKLYACWKYNDATVAKLTVNKVVREGKEGKTLILLITNSTDYVMDIEGEIRYVSSSGKILTKARIFSPSVAKQDVIAPTFSDYGKGKGTFEYSIEARPPRFSDKSIRSRITTEEVSVKKGKVTLKITNKSEETLNLFDVKAYAAQANSPSDGGFAYCGGEEYDPTLMPGASTTVSFGADDWDAPWPDLERHYYFDGYAE